MQEVGFYDSKPLICSLSCTKCGNMVNLNYDQNITQEYIMELSKTIMCICLLYTSPSPRDGLLSRMPSSA